MRVILLLRQDCCHSEFTDIRLQRATFVRVKVPQQRKFHEGILQGSKCLHDQLCHVERVESLLISQVCERFCYFTVMSYELSVEV